MVDVLDKVAEWLAPLKGAFKITTQYGAPVAAGSTKGAPHFGIDLGAPEGTPVYAPRDAVVKRADSKDAGGGNIVELVAGDTSVLFAHLRNFVVQPGETVKAGEIIGYVGKTGASVTGAHLHLETRKNGKLFNPLDLFDPTHSPSPSAYSEEVRRVPLQGDGNCPKGYHRRDDGFFGIGASGTAYCERDNLLGDVVSNGLDVGKSVGVALAGVIQFFVSLLDPANWLAWAALGGGTMLSLFGLYMIWQAT